MISSSGAVALFQRTSTISVHFISIPIRIRAATDVLSLALGFSLKFRPS
jgi:hypothetical protein